MKRLFSGIQPTGLIHIGNWLGAIKNWVDLQDKYESIFCVVDYHAITSNYDKKTFVQTRDNLVKWYIACGIDPEKAVIFLQSDICEHTELAWILNTITPVGELKRMTQFKEKSGKDQDQANMGLFDYPVLMAADILLYKAEVVPVGEDQLQHLELARIIARKFNNKFGQAFPEPQSILSSGARIMALNNPQKKMSKSIPGSYIAMGASENEIRSTIMKAVTDVGPVAGEMGPGVKNLFTVLENVSDKKTYQDFIDKYNKGELKYSELKNQLADDLIATLKPIQERYNELSKDPERIKQILKDGAEKIRPIAQETMKDVKEKMGLA